MKKKSRKLSLSRETLAKLEIRMLDQVAGGVRSLGSCTSSYTCYTCDYHCAEPQPLRAQSDHTKEWR